MTKGGSGKPKVLGRLIFGEKRKQHASPTRRQPATRTGRNPADLSPSPPPPVAAAHTHKTPINIHDWSVWRMQLNEQMGGGMIDRRTELKQIRQFLQNNSFYQQHSHDPSNGRFNGVRLLFSIPRAKFRADNGENSRGTTKSNTNETMEEISVVDPQQRIRSRSDEYTTSAALIPTTQPPMVMDKTISQLFQKLAVENTGGFFQVNEQMIAADIMRNRRTGRSSFRATDRIHSTLQKAVKDGNVLEKIKVFEMQAAAAQAESAMKLGGLNHRVQTVTSSLQSAACRTLSPASIHPITPIPLQQQQCHPIRTSRDHPVQPRRDASHGPIIGHESRKGAHVLEPAHGDIILKRRTPSQRTAQDEDYSITAISSLAVTSSQGHHHQQQHRNRPQQHQQRHHASRSRPRQEVIYDKRALSNHEHTSHKSKGTTTPSSKSSARRRWLKGRKETPTETPTPKEKPEGKSGKSSKGHKSKKKPVEQDKVTVKRESTSDPKRKSSTDNNRVYGVPKPEIDDPIKLDSSPPPPHLEEKLESDPEKDNTNTYMAPKVVESFSNRECEIVPISHIPRRTSKKQHQHKLSSTDGEILNKITDQFDPNDDEVFLTDSPLKPPSNITRHQSAVNLSNPEVRHFHRHTSQYSADELTPNLHRYQRSNENLSKKKTLPLTIITRKNKLNPDEQNVYETPQSEQVLTSTCHPHTLKKQRPFHTITASTNGNNKQISKQILHAIMNSMNNTQDQPTRTSSVYDEFFENGPLSNPEETLANITS